MVGNTQIKPIKEHRCVNGDCVFAPELYTWDKRESGYCSSPTQCLVALNGKVQLDNKPNNYFKTVDDDFKEGPQCINDSQFILDNYCSNSIWETRTKKIALELLQLVNLTGDMNDYTLYCDNFENSLVDTSSSVVIERISGPSLTGIHGDRHSCFDEVGERLEPCVNNFCVLDYVEKGVMNNPKRVVAVSLNKDVNDSANSFLVTLLDNNQDPHNPSDCDSVTDNTVSSFKVCNDDTLWYSKELNSVMYSRDGIDFKTGSSIINDVIIWIKNKIFGIINWVTKNPSNIPELNSDLSFTKKTSRINRLYLAVSQDKKVYAVWPDGTKHWLNMSAKTFSDSGRDWNSIFIVNDAELNFYKTGPDITR